MTNWKLTLEYDGTEFSGWQIQANARTVQEELERGLAQIAGSFVRVAGGGRTDTGVHATGQVVSMELEKRFQPEALKRSLNGVLPYDIAVLGAEVADPDFHARFSACARRYRYSIIQRPSAIGRQYSWMCFYPLDLTLLETCAARIIGEHDFMSFAKTGSETEHGLCRVTEAHWTGTKDGLEFTITANRFLYGMVRALVGTMVEVARGYRQPSDWTAIMEARERQAAGAAAPAHGLCLLAIQYDGITSPRRQNVES